MTTRRIYLALYIVLALAPGAAKLLRVPDHRIDGVWAPAPRPELTLAGVRSESYQTQFTSWFEASLGLRAWEIWADNTALLHGFGETRYGSIVELGKDHVLFERDDIEFHNRGPDALPTDAWARELADDIATLQQKLAARHQAFVPVFIPSKTSFYRDEVPDKWTRDFGPDPRPAQRTMLAIKAELDRRGVAYVDGIELLTTSNLPREQLWGRGARHFAAMAGCLVNQAVLGRFAELTGRRIDYPCVAKKLAKPPREHGDLDLFRLVNAWGAYREREIYESVKPSIDPPADPPSLLWIATSFAWIMEYDAQLSQRFKGLWVDYYNNTLYVDGYRGWSWPVKAHTTGWRDVMLTRDLYVLELNESYVTTPDWFGRDAVRALLDELR